MKMPDLNCKEHNWCGVASRTGRDGHGKLLPAGVEKAKAHI